MGIWKGSAAGAAGTTARIAEKLTSVIGITVSGDEETRSNQLSGTRGIEAQGVDGR